MNLKEKALSENLRGLGRVAPLPPTPRKCPLPRRTIPKKFAAIWEFAAVLSEAAGFPKI